jgi:membrane protease YdiL (CAAX protease family)
VALFYGPVALGSALWLGWRLGPDGLLLRLVGTAPLRDLLVGVAAGLVVVAVSRWSLARFAWARRLARSMADTLGPLSFGACMLFATFSALGEELLFRGVLQPWLGWLPATLLFAAAHVPTGRDLVAWPAFALVAGVLLAGLFELTSALLAPIACHFVVNLLNLRALGALAAQDERDRRDEGFFQ